MKLTSSYYKQVTISDPVTGALVVPTSIAAALYKNNVVIAGWANTVATPSTGLYTIVSTNTFATDGFAEGDKGECIVTVVISGVTYSAVVDSFEMETIPLAADIAAAVWNYLTAAMITADSIGKKLADWVIVTIDDIKTAILKTTTHAIEADENGFVTYANAAPPSISGLATEANATANKTALQKILEADTKILTTTTPWCVAFYEKGTTTELFRKSLKDIDGDNITAAGVVVGQHIHTTP